MPPHIFEPPGAVLGCEGGGATSALAWLDAHANKPNAETTINSTFSMTFSPLAAPSRCRARV
jgi:hypothetical protein